MKKTLIWTIGIILTLLVVGGIVAGVFFLPSATQLGVSGIKGFSILSVDLVDNLQSELGADSPFTGESWVMTFRQGGLGQRAFGTFEPEDIEDKTSGDLKTENDFTLEVEYDNQECVYPVERAGNFKPIYDLQLSEWNCALNPSESTAKSKSGFDGIVWYGRYGGLSIKCWAIGYNTKSEVGIFGRTDLRSKMNVNIDAGSRSGSKTLDTEGSIQGAISNFAYVIWQGNLDTGKSCSYTTTMPFIPIYKNGRWIVGDKQSYDRYVSKLDTRPINKDDALDDYVISAKSKADKAKISQSFGSWSNPTSFNSAVLREVIQAPNQYPVITAYIKASTLGIYTPTPKIELISAKTDCFKTGDEGIITIIAKNKGTESGVWNFYGECVDSDFDITQSREYGLDAGEERELIMPISATSTSRKTGKCTIFAESPAGIKSIDVTVCVDPQATCTPNKKFCGTSGGLDIIKQCSSSGATSETIKTCKSDEVCDASEGEPKCVKEGIGGGLLKRLFDSIFGGLWTTINNFLEKFQIVFSVVAGILGGVVGALYGNRFIPKGIKRRGLYLSGIFILLGTAIGVVAMIYFWWIIFGLLLLLILKIFI